MQFLWQREHKGRDLTQSYGKLPYTYRKLQKATWQHKNATKPSITCNDYDREGLSAAHPLRQNDYFNTPIRNLPFLNSNIPSSPTYPMVCLSHSSYGMSVVAALMNVLFWERRDFLVSFSGRVISEKFDIVLQEVLRTILGSNQTLWSLPWDQMLHGILEHGHIQWHLHWSDISLNWTVLSFLTLSP